MQLYANDRSTPAAKNCAEACPRGATHTQGQGWQPRAPGCNGTGVAKRSYPTSEVRGSSLECQAALAQEQPRGATLHPRSGAVARRSHPTSKEWWLRRRRRAYRSYPTLKVRNGGGKEIPLVQGKEQWLCFAGAAMKRYPMPKVRETRVRW